MIDIEKKDVFMEVKAVYSFEEPTEYAVSNSQEYFANAFAEYILFSEELETLRPEMFQYMEKILVD